MNVYDFDKTIFYPDSSTCFIWYALHKYPAAFVRRIPIIIKTFSRYALGKTDTKTLKETLFSFLADVSGREQLVIDFWTVYKDHILDWYLKQRQSSDVIISASPEFLLRPVARELNFQLIGTVMDINTGKIVGRNCHDREKVNRFIEKYPNESVNFFYSDSYSDTPMAELAQKAYLVKKGSLKSWD